MQFRVTRTKYRGTVRQYGQIVESYRRASDGMPMHRVIAALGVVTDEQAANLKAAFAANRAGLRLHVVDGQTLARIVAMPAWTRDLLDVCAVLQAWQDSGLRSVLRDVFAGHGEEVHPADVVAALVAQRCVAPDSKLAACTWFADTALPELLGVAPAQFHNTRVHRVLERLESRDEELQIAMTGALMRADGQACRAFFIDCTDTWFTGDGPEMGQRGKVKEGMYRVKVGIVLLCRQDGMPLRFKVIQGNTDDGVAMLAMLRGMRAEAWLGSAPVVCDRALGNTADLLNLAELGLRFVTALVSNEHAAYGAVVDCPALVDLDHEAPDSLDRAGAEVVKAGLQHHAHNLYLLDRSVIQRGDDDRAAAEAALGTRTRTTWRRGDDLAHDMLALARQYRDAVDSGQVASYSALQRGLGRSNGHMHRFLNLLKLARSVQSRIDQGHGSNLSKKALERISACRGEAAQAAAFDLECALAAAPRRPGGQPGRPPDDRGHACVRVVVVFNPELWRRKRRTANRRQQRLELLVTKQNQLLAEGKIGVVRAEHKVLNAIADLRLSHTFKVERRTTSEGIAQLELERDDKAWRKARARDGFHVVVASPDVELTAVELVRLYRSKDKIEKDFREIKSVLDLRPVRHRTDAKVRAHVTLCVLALAVQRWMEKRLAAAGRSESAETALAELRNVRLVGMQFPDTGEVIATPNQASPDRSALATALGVQWGLNAGTLNEHMRMTRE